MPNPQVTANLINQVYQQQLDVTTNTAVWPIWVQNSISTTGTTPMQSVAMYNHQQVWYQWATCTFSSSTSFTQQSIIYANWVTQQALVQETREQKERRGYVVWFNNFWRQIYLILIEAVADQAKAKAKALLVEYLNKEQEEMFQKTGYFITEVEGVKYRIQSGRGVIELNQEGKPAFSYCIHHQVNVPDADTMLAQKLLLETDLPTFKRIANRTVYYS